MKANPVNKSIAIKFGKCLLVDLNLPKNTLKKHGFSKGLHSNKDKVITRPDKGSDLEILDKTFYEEKT